MTDADLIRHLKSGDMEAFSTLIDRHKNYAFTIANRIVKSPEEAEEIIQDAFVKVYKSVDSFKGDAKFTTWFYRIVFNTAVSSNRKNRLDTTSLNDSLIPKGGTESQDEMASSNRKQFIHQALQELSDDDKLIITLFYFDEMSLEEIAEVMSQDKSNLKVRLFRARKKLSTQLNYLLKGEAATLL